MPIIVSLALLLLSFQEAHMLQTPRGLSRDVYGTYAPDFRARSIDGREYRLTSFRGRYVLLDFWAIHHDYKDREIVIFGIDIGEERSKVQTFLEKTPAPYPILLDIHID
jgi:hypothetical protein